MGLKKQVSFNNSAKKYDGLFPIMQCADDFVFYMLTNKGGTRNDVIERVPKEVSREVFSHIYSLYQRLLYGDMLYGDIFENFRLSDVGGGRIYRLTELFPYEDSLKMCIQKSAIVLKDSLLLLKEVHSIQEIL